MDTGFERIAPYLKDPLVLIGFFLLIAFSFSRYLVKQHIIPPLPKALGYRILRMLLLYGFIIGLLLIIFGFALRRQELINHKRTEEHIELMLRDALNRAPWLSEEKKDELIQQIVAGYRSGALSKEQVEKKAEEIKISLTQNYNSLPAPSLVPNQSNSSSRIEETKSIPLIPQVPIDNPLLRSKQPIEVTTGNGNQSTPGPNRELYSPPREEFRHTVVLLTPPEQNSTCVVEITIPPPHTAERGVLVKGTANIPIGRYLWILARPRFVKGWWPQGGGATEINEGRWEINVVTATPDDIEFEIVAIVVDTQTNEYLMKWVRDAPREGYPPINFPNWDQECSEKVVKVYKVEG